MKRLHLIIIKAICNSLFISLAGRVPVVMIVMQSMQERQRVMMIDTLYF